MATQRIVCDPKVLADESIDWPTAIWRHAMENKIIRPTDVEARGGYRIWLRYSDGVDGEVDLAHLAGRGVFAGWRDRAFFEAVRLTEAGAIAWGDDIELCPDALYMDLTGKAVEEVMPGARPVAADA